MVVLVLVWLLVAFPPALHRIQGGLYGIVSTNPQRLACGIIVEIAMLSDFEVRNSLGRPLSDRPGTESFRIDQGNGIAVGILIEVRPYCEAKRILTKEAPDRRVIVARAVIPARSI
jgi:hypothetical protein